MRYVEGFVIPVPGGDKQAYLSSANNMTTLLKRLGATCVFERWGSDLERAVGARGGDDVVLGWVEWPSKEARDAASWRSKAFPEAAIA